MILNSLADVVKTLLSFYGSFGYYWIQGGSYDKCPFFRTDLHAKTFVYSMVLLQTLWNQPHYRHSSFRHDLVLNLRNVAVPGTAIPLSTLCYSRIVLFPFLMFVYPILCTLGAFFETWNTTTGVLAKVEKWLQMFRQILVNPQHWFGFWRLNCHLVSLHSWKYSSQGYRMENKWDFLEKCVEESIAVTPFLDAPKTLVVKDRNEEGGLGIFFYQNAVHGGDWILQEKLENSKFIGSLLPENAPLSTFRIITASKCGIPDHNAFNGDKTIKALSCVFRAGLNGASTDHKSIMFDVDMETGEILKGSTTTHWYKIGLKHLFNGPFSRGHDITAHPDTGTVITGQFVREIKEMKSLVLKAHQTLMKDVPLCGWDVALTEKGAVLLEVNISCNFFRGTFDQQWYFELVDGYFTNCERKKGV